MTSFEFAIATAFRSLATRESGAEARQSVLQALEWHPLIVLNFDGAHPSPSFADELVGKLAAILGANAFRERVQIVGVGDAERLLLNHVIAQRLRKIVSAGTDLDRPTRVSVA